MNYVNFNNFQPLNETVYTREEAKTAILMVETKNTAKANILVANLPEEGNSIKTILSLVENKLDMVSALKAAKELLERNAFLGALAKAREAKAKTFEFNGKEYEVFGADVSEEEAVEEKFKYTEDQVNMAYGFYGSLETVYKEAQVQKMFTDAVADLMKAFKISEEVALLVLNAPIGRHTADMLYSKFAATASEGILKYFGGSEAKAKNFINQMHKANEAMNPNTELKEALTSKKPNEVETIELDMAWDDSDKEEDKAAKAAFKKYKLTVKGANGQPGTYEMTGKKKDILAYLQSEFYEMDADTVEEYYPELLEANSNYGAPAGLSKAETKKVAETLAKAISKNDGVKCTVNVKTLEEDSFDLDVDGEEYDGGSYNIYDDGSVRNMAVRGEKYGTTTSTVEDFIKGLKKPVKESVINEALSKEQKMVETFLNKIAKEFDYSIQDAVRFVKETISKMGLDEAKVNEDETLIFDEVGTTLTQLQDQIIMMLGWDIKDQKWINGLKAIQKDLDRVENTIAKFDQKLGAIEYNESVTEANDHEVGMANGQLLDIAKNAAELMKKIGETEKDLPGWIQDHISQAQNFLNQANTSYHELEESTELEEAKKYDLGFGSLGNGTTVWNRAQEVNGDYKTVAHISVGGNITYYDKKMPEDVKKQIEDMAANESTITEKVDMAELENTLKRVKKENPGKKVGYIFVQDAPKGYKISIDGKYTNESFNEGAMADIDIMAQEAKDFKAFVKAFTKEHHDLSKAGEPGQFESWLKSIYDNAKENMDESVIAEAKKVKFVLYTNPGNSTSAGYVAIGTEDVREVLSDAKRYSDSYKILYQGSGTQADLVKAKNMFSDYSFGNESIDENTDESLVTEKDEAVFIEFLNKDKNFKKDTKHFKSYDEAVKWAKANFDKFSPDMIKYESLEINEKNEVTVSLRYAVQANDIFDDMYRKLGEKESTDVFSFKSKTYANDFIESLIMVGVPKNEIN